jgi:hypothetical protein
MRGCLAVFGEVPSFVRLFHSKIPSSILAKLEISRQLFAFALDEFTDKHKKSVQIERARTSRFL